MEYEAALCLALGALAVVLARRGTLTLLAIREMPA